jgi:hypothetical protein
VELRFPSPTLPRESSDATAPSHSDLRRVGIRRLTSSSVFLRPPSSRQCGIVEHRKYIAPSGLTTAKSIIRATTPIIRANDDEDICVAIALEGADSTFDVILEVR